MEKEGKHLKKVLYSYLEVFKTRTFKEILQVLVMSFILAIIDGFIGISDYVMGILIVFIIGICFILSMEEGFNKECRVDILYCLLCLALVFPSLNLWSPLFYSSNEIYSINDDRIFTVKYLDSEKSYMVKMKNDDGSLGVMKLSEYHTIVNFDDTESPRLINTMIPYPLWFKCLFAPVTIMHKKGPNVLLLPVNTNFI